MARGYRHLPRVSDSVIDLDEGHQASHVNHVPIMPVVSVATEESAEGSACVPTRLQGWRLGPLRWPRLCRVGLLTFSINLTLDGCVDHKEGIADDETHAHFTRLMDESGAMLWGRITYEMMEGYWPAVARGDVKAPGAMREWALKLEAKPKYIVSATRSEFPWTNSNHVVGDLRMAVQELKDGTPSGVLVGSSKLAAELDRLDLIDEYRFLVHPMITGHGPTLYRNGLPRTRRLDLISAEPLSNGAVAIHYRRTA